jgi:hypothetical protein
MRQRRELITYARMVEIMSGSAPVADERFVVGHLLMKKTTTERIELALRTELSWSKFSRRFEALTGIRRDRVHMPSGMYVFGQ